MKAYRITSTEYRANHPSVFLFVNGEYYGDLSYPRVRKFPKSIEYWKTATCSDSDRFFNIEEVEVAEETVIKLKGLHEEIIENGKNILPYTPYKPNMTKKEREEDNEENRRRERLNAPYDKKHIQLTSQIEFIIKSL